MQQDGIRRILTHWKKRQNEGLVPFMFSHILRAGEMIQAPPLDVPIQALQALSVHVGEREDIDTDELDVPLVMPSDVSSNITSHTAVPDGPPVSRHYPSPAPTALSGNDCLSPPPQSVTPDTRSPSPDPGALNLVIPPTFEVQGPASAEYLEGSVIDPIIPQLTKAQLLVTGPAAFTTNSLSGARISPSSATGPGSITVQLSPGDAVSVSANRSATALAEVMTTHASAQTFDLPMDFPTPVPVVPSKKRGRPRKSLVETAAVEGISPSKKRARITKSAATNAVASTSKANSMPNAAPVPARPTPRPIRKGIGKEIDMANVQPYEGLITRRMATGKTEKLVMEKGSHKAIGMGAK